MSPSDLLLHVEVIVAADDEIDSRHLLHEFHVVRHVLVRDGDDHVRALARSDATASRAAVTTSVDSTYDFFSG